MTFQPFTEAEGKASLADQKKLADSGAVPRGMIGAPIDSEALLLGVERRCKVLTEILAAERRYLARLQDDDFYRPALAAAVSRHRGELGRLLSTRDHLRRAIAAAKEDLS